MNGFDNLFAMEVDPNIGFAELPEEYFTGIGENDAWRNSKGVIQVLLPVASVSWHKTSSEGHSDQ